MPQEQDMGPERFTVSVVCPAFNEEHVLPLFHRQLAAVLDKLPEASQVEVIYVDDGSRDGTLAVLRALGVHDTRIRHLSFSRNFGHQAALTAGLEAARGDVVITLDSDLQHPPALIPLLLERWREGHDVVITIRAESANSGRLQRWLSRWFYVGMGWLSDTEIRPAAADFRLLSRRAVDALLALRETDRFLRGQVQWLGYPAAEVSYTPAPRAGGESKYTLRRRLRLALDGLLSFSKVPLRLPLLAGMLIMASGLAAEIIALFLCWSLREQTAALAAAVLGSIHLVGGGILCSLGILGEYLGRIHDQVRARPAYILKEDSGRSGPINAVKGPQTPVLRGEQSDGRPAAAA